MTAALAGSAQPIRAPHSGSLGFRFSDINPLTGRPFSMSRFDDLPMFIADRVEHLGFNSWTWNKLVRRGEVAEEIDCHKVHGIPWTAYRKLRAPRTGKAPEGKCEDCWGTCLDIDADGSITGVIGGSFVCACTRYQSRSAR